MKHPSKYRNHRNRGMQSNQIKILIAFLLLSFMFSCAGKIDINPPEVLIAQPLEEQAILTGGPLQFTAEFTDDVNLSSFVVEFRNTNSLMVNSFDTLIEKNIQGINASVNLDIDIPLEANGGEYELIVHCSDRLNNSSEEIVRKVKILNAIDSEYPKLNISNLQSDRTTTVFKGSNIVFLGEATDNKELGELFIRLYRRNSLELYNEIDAVKLYGKKTHSIGEYIAAPRQAGLFTAEVILTDAVNNRSRMLFDLEVR